MSNVGVVRARDRAKWQEEQKRKKDRPERYQPGFKPLKRFATTPVVREGANNWRLYPSLTGKK